MIDPVQTVRVDTLGGAGSARPARATDVGDANQASGFGDSIGSALNNLSNAESRADAAALAGATGDLSSVSDFMVAATEAQLATEVTVAVRNRAIEAFNDIMRMQV
jgi:flagellar hook-basal body complex protein FliE